MAKMAAVPVCGLIFKIFFSGTKRPNDNSWITFVVFFSERSIMLPAKGLESRLARA